MIDTNCQTRSRNLSRYLNNLIADQIPWGQSRTKSSLYFFLVTSITSHKVTIAPVMGGSSLHINAFKSLGVRSKEHCCKFCGTLNETAKMHSACTPGDRLSFQQGTLPWYIWKHSRKHIYEYIIGLKFDRRLVNPTAAPQTEWQIWWCIIRNQVNRYLHLNFLC